MEVIKVTPRGYCKGVVRAIQIAKQARQDYPNEDIYILGMLVHNQYVIKALDLLNIKSVENPKLNRYELLNEVPNDCVLIFSAHGISDQVVEAAKAKGCKCIDASCPDVLKTQDIVKKYINDDYHVLYIGKRNHPEAEAVLAISDKIHLITNENDIKLLESYHKIFVTNQTTMSINDVSKLFDAIKDKFPHAIICDEICNATRIRQQAISNLVDQNIDVLFVVGDKKSNNSNRLAQIAKEIKIPKVALIDDVHDIDLNDLTNANKVAITSGASTPTYLTNQVIQYLENLESNQIKPSIDISKML